MIRSVLFLLCCAQVSANAFAAIGAQEFTPVNGSSQERLQLYRKNGIYRFKKDAQIYPRAEYFKGVFTIDPERPYLTFSAGEPVVVHFLKSGSIAISLVSSDEETRRADTPERILISADQFAAIQLEFVSTGDAHELYRNYAAYDSYSVAARGGTSRGRGRDHYRNPSGGSYYGCVAYVCRSIGGCHGTVGNGVGMTNYLRRKGWRSVSCSKPPVGAVASWSGGSGAGHTARWNGRGWCYDLGCGDPGKRYRLKDCVTR